MLFEYCAWPGFVAKREGKEEMVDEEEHKLRRIIAWVSVLMLLRLLWLYTIFVDRSEEDGVEDKLQSIVMNAFVTIIRSVKSSSLSTKAGATLIEAGNCNCFLLAREEIKGHTPLPLHIATLVESVSSRVRRIESPVNRSSRTTLTLNNDGSNLGILVCKRTWISSRPTTMRAFESSTSTTSFFNTCICNITHLFSRDGVVISSDPDHDISIEMLLDATTMEQSSEKSTTHTRVGSVYAMID